MQKYISLARNCSKRFVEAEKGSLISHCIEEDKFKSPEFLNELVKSFPPLKNIIPKIEGIFQEIIKEITDIMKKVIQKALDQYQNLQDQIDALKLRLTSEYQNAFTKEILEESLEDFISTYHQILDLSKKEDTNNLNIANSIYQKVSQVCRDHFESLKGNFFQEQLNHSFTEQKLFSKRLLAIKCYLLMEWKKKELVCYSKQDPRSAIKRFQLYVQNPANLKACYKFDLGESAPVRVQYSNQKEGLIFIENYSKNLFICKVRPNGLKKILTIPQQKNFQYIESTGMILSFINNKLKIMNIYTRSTRDLDMNSNILGIRYSKNLKKLAILIEKGELHLLDLPIRKDFKPSIVKIGDTSTLFSFQFQDDTIILSQKSSQDPISPSVLQLCIIKLQGNSFTQKIESRKIDFSVRHLCLLPRRNIYAIEESDLPKVRFYDMGKKIDVKIIEGSIVAISNKSLIVMRNDDVILVRY